MTDQQHAHVATIRVVDDDQDIALLLATVLEPYCRVLIRTRDIHGLFYEDMWEGVDGTIVDLMMPYVSGKDLIIWLKEHCPWVRCVAYTAMPINSPTVVAVQEYADAVIEKGGRDSVMHLVEKLGLHTLRSFPGDGESTNASG